MSQKQKILENINAMISYYQTNVRESKSHYQQGKMIVSQLVVDDLKTIQQMVMELKEEK